MRFVLCLALLGACTSSYTSITERPGTACETDADCRGGVCVVDVGGRICTSECTDLDPSATCVSGWTCGEGDDTVPTVCRCETRTPERCNGRDDDCDGAIDEDLDCSPTDPEARCGESIECFGLRTEPVDEVDLLFMIDNSGSMAQEQTALSRQLPKLVRALTSGDIDDDGDLDFRPVGSLHVGVVTSDMGTGGFVVPTCGDSRFGDDGILRTQGNVARPGCQAVYPSFLELDRGENADAFVNDLTCVAALGTAGCGFEQQLEAVLKAVTPSTASPRFVEGSVGHADGLNAGFLRPDAALMIVILSDEEDCSAANPEIYDPSSSAYGGDLNLRCWQYGAPEHGVIHPVSRFVDGLLATRTNPSNLVVSGIVGVPEGVSSRAGSTTDWDGILAHPDMQEQVDPMMPSRLRPSCDRTDGAGERSVAFPPRRIVSVLRELEQRGAHSSVHSICQDDLEPEIDVMLATAAGALDTCLPRPLEVVGALTPCVLVETLPPGRVCAELPGRALRERRSGLEVCEVTQLPIGTPSGEGWYYEPESASCPSERPQRVVLTTPPLTGTTTHLECER